MHIPKQSRKILFFIGLISATVLLNACEHNLSITPGKKKKKSVSQTDSRSYEFELNKHWSFAYENYKNDQFEAAKMHFLSLVQMDTIRKFDNAYCYLASCYVQLDEPDSAKYIYEQGTQVVYDDSCFCTNFEDLAAIGLFDDAKLEKCN